MPVYTVFASAEFSADVDLRMRKLRQLMVRRALSLDVQWEPMAMQENLCSLYVPGRRILSSDLVWRFFFLASSDLGV